MLLVHQLLIVTRHYWKPPYRALSMDMSEECAADLYTVPGLQRE